MPSSRPRWGLILATTNAAGGTGFVFYAFDWWRKDVPSECPGCTALVDDPGGMVLAFVSLALVGAWLGVWAWSRERWATAAPALLVSIAIPWGYFVEISGPVILGLTTVATVRAFRSRRARRTAALG
jgi:hypothetical protein